MTTAGNGNVLIASTMTVLLIQCGIGIVLTLLHYPNKMVQLAVDVTQVHIKYITESQQKGMTQGTLSAFLVQFQQPVLHFYSITAATRRASNYCNNSATRLANGETSLICSLLLDSTASTAHRRYSALRYLVQYTWNGMYNN